MRKRRRVEVAGPEDHGEESVDQSAGDQGGAEEDDEGAFGGFGVAVPPTHLRVPGEDQNPERDFCEV